MLAEEVVTTVMDARSFNKNITFTSKDREFVFNRVRHHVGDIENPMQFLDDAEAAIREVERTKHPHAEQTHADLRLMNPPIPTKPCIYCGRPTNAIQFVRGICCLACWNKH